MIPQTTSASVSSTPELADRLRMAVTRLSRRLRREAGVDVSPTQYSALAIVEKRGPLTIGELAEAERLRPPTITKAVSLLEEQGLVVRRPDPKDGRIVRVEVTRAGRRLVARSRALRSAFLAQRLAELDPDERELMERMATILERWLDAPAARVTKESSR